jgi:methionyl-tRNA synthetase
MPGRFYLTTPIYYVNSTPHIGHAYTTIAADILVRHHRQRGDETFFLTGVDEHAQKVYRVAQEEGIDPSEYLDRIVAAWRELPERLNASNDFFIRTSDDAHERFVREFVQRIYDNGDVYEDTYAGWYCVSCEAFYTESDLVEGNCPIHGTKPEWIEEKNYFFRLSAYQQRLLDLYDARPDFVQPAFRYNEARSFIERGLQDFSISRAGQPWGVPLPWDESQVAYVWVDALPNYLSALTYARTGEDLTATFWPGCHLLAKDILRFHCIYWPALLLSAGYEVPERLFVHGWLLLDERKISKSAGNVVDPLGLIDVYGADAVRFWCARAISFGQDGTASIDGLRERYERELGNDLGNLLSRTTAMIARYRRGELGSAGSAGRPFDADALREELIRLFDDFDLTRALDAIWQFVRELNRYVEDQKPWELAKNEAQAEELTATLYDLADGLVAVAVAVAPYLPETAPRILAALRQPPSLDWNRIRNGSAERASGIEPAPPLFPRIEPETAAAAAGA